MLDKTKGGDLHKAVEAAKILRLEIAKMIGVDRIEAGEISAEDAATIQDTFEGETTLEAELLAAIIAEDDDKILLDGIASRMSTLSARKQRIEKRVEARRGLIEQAMTIAGWESQPLGIATISLGKRAPTLEIDEESEIPSRFFKQPDPVLSKSELGKVMKDLHKRIEAAAKLPVVEGIEMLWSLLNDEALPPHVGRAHALTEASKLNDPDTKRDLLLSIARKFPLVPGCHLVTDAKQLTIRR